ncbi:MAG: hypothetical protein HGB29_04135 [Chlorobiaceae bacterium]|nr:hypothetical protein [Chlorobiaceae bacterium]NTW74032.1 hypothetical protein [Chlorobiaceae bacterium]
MNIFVSPHRPYRLLPANAPGSAFRSVQDGPRLMPHGNLGQPEAPLEETT